MLCEAAKPATQRSGGGMENTAEELGKSNNKEERPAHR